MHTFIFYSIIHKTVVMIALSSEGSYNHIKPKETEEEHMPE